MAARGEYTRQEMMAVAASRLVNDGELVLTGFGLPIVAAILAKYTHAPNLVLMTEAGVYDPRPAHLPFCIADSRFAYMSSWFGTPVELLGHILQSRRVDVGFLGGAQVDKYGNLNSTCVGDYLRPAKRFEGSGGAADFAAMSRRTIIMMAHEKRRIVEQVDFITSPGWRCSRFPGGEKVFREEMGMWGGPAAVVTTMGVMKFDPETREMYVESFYADLDVTPEEIRANTGFDIDVSRAEPCTPPTYEELELLRTRIDPERVFIK
ncbi:MAG: acyl CoA--acetate/3-ketoacid CoA transferase subunit beta [Clostridia bacterium]|nr:acyl CoA--acetate/3-ketoacid CoA transferase subunit beta [Clostridia bacterium]